MTNLDYLDDTYRFTGSGSVVELGSSEKGDYFVLDRTLFYPQGGGQPSDLGTIEANEGSFNVEFVQFEAGLVKHFYVPVEANDLRLQVGQTATLKVDEERRLTNAKLHTAGHLIAGIADGSKNGLRATKGFHFPEGPYVEFEGEVSTDPEMFMKFLNDAITSALEEDRSVLAEEVSYFELNNRCANIPSYLPKDKPLRIVTIDGFDPLPCGGTHVARLGELGRVSATKIRFKKGTTKISYSIF